MSVITYPGASLFPGAATWPGFGPGTAGLLFTPPMRRQTVLLEGSLRYSFYVSSTVWKDAGGVWHDREVPYDGDLDGGTVLTSSGPVLVDQVTADELTAAGIGTIT